MSCLPSPSHHYFYRCYKPFPNGWFIIVSSKLVSFNQPNEKSFFWGISRISPSIASGARSEFLLLLTHGISPFKTLKRWGKTQRQSLGDYLVGGWPTPLKNMTRQLGWKHVPNWMEQIKFMFHTTNQLSMANWDNRYSDTPSNQSQMGLLPPSTQKRMGGVGQYTECRVFTGTSSRAPHLGLGWLVYLDGAPIFLTMACPQYN